MKKLIPVLLFTALLTGCEKNEFDFNGNLTDGFCIVANGEVLLNRHDFEFYDYSDHLIYLKDEKSFAGDIESIGGFTVYANKEKIYNGQAIPGYSSFLPSGAVIVDPKLYDEHIIPIDFMLYLDSLGNFLSDPREDPRIANA